MAATHGVFAPAAAEVIRGAAPRAVLVTDTVPAAEASGLATEVVSIAGLLADAIGRMHREEPLGALVRHG